MSNAIGVVSLQGFIVEDTIYTYLLAEGATEAAAASVGVAAMTIDTSAANTLKLAGDGDKIHGILQSYEARDIEDVAVGACAKEGSFKFLVNPNIDTSPTQLPAVGDYLVGAATDAGVKGYVQKATSTQISAGKNNWQVFEVATDNSYVIAMNV